MKTTFIAATMAAVLAGIGGGLLLSPHLKGAATLNGQPAFLSEDRSQIPLDRGLIGRAANLTRSAFCGEYRCEATSTTVHSDAVITQGYAIQLGEDRSEVWETTSQRRVVSLRWSTDLELILIPSQVSRMVRHLARAASGSDVTERQIYDLIGLAVLGETSRLQVGSAQMQTFIQPAGRGRRIHVMIAGDLGEAAPWEPPSTRMNEDERSRALSDLHGKLKMLNGDLGPNEDCQAGINILSAGAFTLENLQLSSSDPLKLTYRTVQEVAQEEGFTRDGVYHTRYPGTTYTLIPSTGEGLCLNVVNGLN